MRGLGKILAYNAAFIVVVILLVELIFGSWFSSNRLEGLNILRNRVWHYDFYYPGVPEAERKIVYSRDQWGLRGNYGQPRDIGLLTVGGSTTDQRYITDGHTWQDVMAAKFGEAGVDLRIANAGVDGRTTFGHLHDFNLWFPQIKGLQPAYILFYVGLNDMLFSEPNSKYDNPHSTIASLQQRAKRNSAVYSLLQSLLGTFLVEQRNIAHSSIDYPNAEWVDAPLQSGYEIKLRDRLADYRTRLASLLDSTGKLGAIPIVVSQPRGDARIIDGQLVGINNSRAAGGGSFRDDVLGVLNAETANGIDYFRILTLFNAVSLEECAKANGICIDLAGELQFDDHDFYDYAHNTRAGAKKIGDYLYRQLADRLQRDSAD